MEQNYKLIFEKVTSLYTAIQKNKKQFNQIFEESTEIAVDAYNFGTKKAEEITDFAKDKVEDVERIAMLCMDVIQKLTNPTETRAMPKSQKECTSSDDIVNRIISQLPVMKFENTQADIPRY